MTSLLAFALAFSQTLEAPQATVPPPRALLVGIGEYSHLDSDLEGPPNDVRILSQALVTRLGFEPSAIETLSGTGESAPTRQRILASMKVLADEALKDQFIVVFVAGHGMPIPDGSIDDVLTLDEGDGTDETLLAADVEPWIEAEGRLPGAIVDDELRVLFKTMVSKGANVWFIADSCFSGTLDRGGDGPVYRSVGLSSLGVPDVRPTTDTDIWAAGELRGAGAEGDGSFVAFSAVRRNEKAEERLLVDPFDETNRVTFGVFTHALVCELLRGRRIRTYRDLIEGVELRLISKGGAPFHPTANGALGNAIGGLDALPWEPSVTRVGKDIVLDLGTFDGVSAGTLVEVVDRAGERLVLRVEEPRLFRSLCSPLDPGVDLRQALPMAARTKAVLTAEPGGDRSVPIHVIAESEWIQEGLRDPEAKGWIRLVDDDAEADWILEELSDAVVLRRATQPARVFAVRSGELEASLRKVYAARGLRRLANHPWVGQLPEGLSVDLEACAPGGSWERIGAGRQPAPGASGRIIVRNKTEEDWRVHCFVIDPNLDITPVVLEGVLAPSSASTQVEQELYFYDDGLGAGQLISIATRDGVSPVDSDWASNVAQGPLDLRRGSTDPVAADKGPTRGDDGTGGDPPRKPGTPFGLLLDTLTRPSRSTSSAEYREVEAYVSAVSYDLAWPVPSLSPGSGPKLEGGGEALGQAIGIADLPVDVQLGEEVRWLDERQDILACSGLGSVAWLFDPSGKTFVEGLQVSDGSMQQILRDGYKPRFLIAVLDQGVITAYDEHGTAVGWDLVLVDRDGDLIADEVFRCSEGFWFEERDAFADLVQVCGVLFPSEAGELSEAPIQRLREALTQVDWEGARSSSFASNTGAAGPSRGSSVGVSFAAPELRQMIDGLMERRSLHSTFRGPVAFRVTANTDEVNARAGRNRRGGPFLEITSGMLQVLEMDKRMIRAVVAHELAHLVLGHAHDSRRPAGPHAESADIEHAFSRQQEAEADALAAEMLEETGYKRADLAEALLRLHRYSRSQSMPWFAQVMDDHGSPIHRMAALEPNDKRFDALEAMERGLGLMECRRPDLALLAFEEAVTLCPDLYEARYLESRALLQRYYERVAVEVRSLWLRPLFGPLLTLDDVTITRGQEVTQEDRKLWEQARAAVAKLPRSAYPTTFDFLAGSVDVLHPDADQETLKSGVARLQALHASLGTANRNSATLRFQTANNLALGLHRLRQQEAAWNQISEAIEEMFPVNSTTVLRNAADLAVQLRIDECNASVKDALLGLWVGGAYSEDQRSELMKVLKKVASSEFTDAQSIAEGRQLVLAPATAIRVGDARVDLTAHESTIKQALGQPDLDEPIHPDYEYLRQLIWNDDAGKMLASALVEDGFLLKFTSRSKDAALLLQPAEEGSAVTESIAIGLRQEDLVALAQRSSLKGARLVRETRRGSLEGEQPIESYEPEDWWRFPDFHFALQLESERVTGLTIAVARPRQR